MNANEDYNTWQSDAALTGEKMTAFIETVILSLKHVAWCEQERNKDVGGDGESVSLTSLINRIKPFSF